jgi:hypothetical protein
MRFEEILDQCISEVLAGASVEECVARYPQQADELRPLLNVAVLLTQVGQAEGTAAAKARGKQRLLAALARESRSKVTANRPCDTSFKITPGRFAPHGV